MERVEGGYRFTGHKHFGSLTPVWTRLGLHVVFVPDRYIGRVVPAGAAGIDAFILGIFAWG